MQRFGASTWSGDINNDFPTLEAQVPLGLNTGLSGVPYWGTDVGGFFHPVPETGELYARWFQFGAFNPDLPFARLGVARAHAVGLTVPRSKRSAGSTPSCAIACCRTTYTLPGLAGARASVCRSCRPLVLNYPDDPKTLDARPRIPVGVTICWSRR